MTGNERLSVEEICDEIKKEILEEQRPYLCKYLETKAYFPYLRSCAILSKDDEQIILAEPTQSQQAHKFIDKLLMKGPRAYEGLVKAITFNRTQAFLAEKLNKEFERKKNNLKSLLEGNENKRDPQLPVDTSSLPRPTPRRVATEDSTVVNTNATCLKLKTESSA